MNCEHATYQCLPAMMAQDERGQATIVVPMWCMTCGAIALRLPQLDAGDERRAALRAGSGPTPLRAGR